MAHPSGGGHLRPHPPPHTFNKEWATRLPTRSDPGSEGAPVTVKSPRLGTKWAAGQTAPRIGQGRETGHASKQVALCGHDPPHPPPGPCMPGGEDLVRGAWSARG